MQCTRCVCVLTFAGAALIVCTAGEAQEKGKKDPKQKDAAVLLTDEWICNVRKVADYGTYCLYYAVNCTTGEPSGWSNSNCNLAPGLCGNPMEPECEKIPAFEKKKKENGAKQQRFAFAAKHGHVENGLRKNGIPAPKKKDYVPTLVGASKLIGNHLVEIETPSGEFIRARLHLILVPKMGKYSQQVLGQGVEVEESNDKPDFKIPYDEAVTMFNQKTCHLVLGGTNYTVIFHTTPRVKRDEPPLQDSAGAGQAVAPAPLDSMPSSVLPMQQRRGFFAGARLRRSRCP